MHNEYAENEFSAGDFLPNGLRSAKCLECNHVVASERRVMYVVMGYVSVILAENLRFGPT